MCWIAPLIPQARYSSGEIRVPVWPTCCLCGRQPSLVTTRDTPDRAAEQRRPAPRAARSPRGRRRRARRRPRRARWPATPRRCARPTRPRGPRRSASASGGSGRCTLVAPGPAHRLGTASTASAATVSSASGAVEFARPPAGCPPSDAGRAATGRAAVGGGRDAVGGHRQAGDRAEVGQHLAAPVGTRRDHGRGGQSGGQPGQGPGPGLRRVPGQRLRGPRSRKRRVTP